jgi:hypothetical protein
MAITVSGTTLTFNDATTQTTARTSSNTVTSIVAGTGISISGATGAVTITCNGVMQNTHFFHVMLNMLSLTKCIRRA